MTAFRISARIVVSIGLLALAFTGCKEDACKDELPELEVAFRLDKIAPNDVKEIAVTGEFTHGPEPKIKSLTLTADEADVATDGTGVFSIEFADPEINKHGPFTLTLRAKAFDGRTLGTAKAEIDSLQPNACNFVNLVITAGTPAASVLDLVQTPANIVIEGAAPGPVAVCNVLGQHGKPDLIVAYPMASEPPAAPQAGLVYVFDGAALNSATTLNDAAMVVVGEKANDKLGSSLLCADLNGDTFDDLVLGAPDAAEGDGRVYVLLGGPTPSAKEILLDDGAVNLTVLGPAGATERIGTSLTSLAGWMPGKQRALAIGAPGFDGGRGAVYTIVAASEQDWQQAPNTLRGYAQLSTPLDDVQWKADGEAGGALASNSELTAIGVPFADGDKGAVYVRRKSATVDWEGWLPTGGFDKGFGAAVAVSGKNMVAVGVPGAQTVLLYQYEETAPGKWSILKTDTKPAAAEFGAAVALSENWLVVGAPGSGQAFAYKYTSSESPELDSPKTGRFGAAVAIQQDPQDADKWTICIGAPNEAIGTVATVANAGAVYCYEGGDETSPRKLQADEVQENARFGAALALGDETLIVGAPGTEVRSKRQAGAIHVFDRNVSPPWSQVRVDPVRPQADAAFGSSLSALAGWLVVGAPGPGSNEQPGAAYLLRKESVTSWPHVTRLLHRHSGRQDRFGWSVSLHSPDATGNAVVLVGAPGHDRPGTPEALDAGAVYRFGISPMPVVRLQGTDPTDKLGTVVAAGSIDEDGFDDLVATAPNRSCNDKPPLRCGGVLHLAGDDYSGKVGLIGGDSKLIIVGHANTTSDGFGDALAIVPSVGGGNPGGLLISAPNTDGDSGSFYLLSNDAVKPTPTGDLKIEDKPYSAAFAYAGAQASFGLTLLPITRSNSDFDMVVAAPGCENTGCVYVIPSRASYTKGSVITVSSDEDVQLKIIGTQPSATPNMRGRLGVHMAAGDLDDSSKVPDLVLTEPGANKVHIIFR